MSKLFGGLKTNLARMQHTAMAKMGKAEATVDAEFDQAAANFKEQHSKTKKLSKFVHNYEQSVADLSSAQNGIAQMVMDQYENHCKCYRAAAQYEKVSADIESIRKELLQRFEDGFHKPLTDYLAQYKQAEDRINERNNRLVDMDRHRNELKSLMEKGAQCEPTRLQISKERSDIATQAYAELNAELLRDLPALTQDRFMFFDSLFANIVDAQVWFFSEYLRTLQSMEVYLRDVDRFEHRGHRWIITDESVSAFRKASFVPGEAIPSGGAPPSSVAARPMPTPAAAGARPGGAAPAAAAGVAAVGAGAGAAAYASQPPSAYASQPQYASQPPSAYASQPQYAPMPTPAAVPVAAAAMRAQALYPFKGEDATELSFNFNDIIIVHRQGGDWWEGELNGQRGLFPANYVKLL